MRLVNEQTRSLLITRRLGIWTLISRSIRISCRARAPLVRSGAALLEGRPRVSTIVVVPKRRVCPIILWGRILAWPTALAKSALRVTNRPRPLRHNIWNLLCLSVVTRSCSYLCMVRAEAKVMLGLRRRWLRVSSVCRTRCWLRGATLLGKKESRPTRRLPG